MTSAAKHRHHHEALCGSSSPAVIGTYLYLDVEQVHQPPEGGRVELAERLLHGVADLTENRPADVHRTASVSPAYTRAAATIGLLHHPPGDPEHQSQADTIGQG